jgi:hypothetical protein
LKCGVLGRHASEKYHQVIERNRVGAEWTVHGMEDHGRRNIQPNGFASPGNERVAQVKLVTIIGVLAVLHPGP